MASSPSLFRPENIWDAEDGLPTTRSALITRGECRAVLLWHAALVLLVPLCGFLTGCATEVQLMATAADAKLNIAPIGEARFRLECVPVLVKDKGGSTEEEIKISSMHHRPYQDLLDQVAARLKPKVTSS